MHITRRFFWNIFELNQQKLSSTLKLANMTKIVSTPNAYNNSQDNKSPLQLHHYGKSTLYLKYHEIIRTY